MKFPWKSIPIVLQNYSICARHFNPIIRFARVTGYKQFKNQIKFSQNRNVCFSFLIKNCNEQLFILLKLVIYLSSYFQLFEYILNFNQINNFVLKIQNKKIQLIIKTKIFLLQLNVFSSMHHWNKINIYIILNNYLIDSILKNSTFLFAESIKYFLSV